MASATFPRIFHRLALLSLAAAALLTSSCRSANNPPPPTTWTTGYWFWNGSSASEAHVDAPLDALYVEVSGVFYDGRWQLNTHPPERLPKAKEYWAVIRSDYRQVPHLEDIPQLSESFAALAKNLSQQGRHLAGLQLDIDYPTGQLADYAEFLHEVKKSLPPGQRLSITALLDWFEPRTDILKVIAEVDEFVPQFYDLSREDYEKEGSIASPVDAQRWAERFNRLRKSYRIGISTFGRARALSDRPGKYSSFYLDSQSAPLAYANNPSLTQQIDHTPAREVVLNYRVVRPFQDKYSQHPQGDIVRFTLPTTESVSAAVAQAKQMRGYCAGVILFRWPAFEEALALSPRDALAAAGALPPEPSHPVLKTFDAACATVHCLDLYLYTPQSRRSQAIHHVIRASVPLEYLVPAEDIPVRLTKSQTIEITFPPYTGRGRLYLGRVASLQPAQFSVEEVP